MSSQTDKDTFRPVWMLLTSLAARSLPTGHRRVVLGDLEEELGPLNEPTVRLISLVEILRISIRFHSAALTQPATRITLLKSTLLFIGALYSLSASATITFGNVNHPIGTQSLTPGYALSWLVASGSAAFLLGRTSCSGLTIGFIGMIWMVGAHLIPQATGLEAVTPAAFLMITGVVVGTTAGRTTKPHDDTVAIDTGTSDYHV